MIRNIQATFSVLVTNVFNSYCLHNLDLNLHWWFHNPNPAGSPQNAKRMLPNRKSPKISASDCKICAKWLDGGKMRLKKERSWIRNWLDPSRWRDKPQRISQTIPLGSNNSPKIPKFREKGGEELHKITAANALSGGTKLNASVYL